MCRDAALPPDDWGNTAPVGHTLSCYKRAYKLHNPSPNEGREFLADKVKIADLF